jgi:modulator of FtsH protease
VSTAYSAADWTDFGAASATAAAALVGFLFIAMSINLRQILDAPNLPGRAGLTLILLGTPLVSSLLLIVPGQGRVALGVELLITGLAIGAGQVVLDLRNKLSEFETRVTWLIGRIGPAVASTVCLAVAGGTLLAQAGGGLYWMVPAVLVAFICGLLNVWVLLVEILR